MRNALADVRLSQVLESVKFDGNEGYRVANRKHGIFFYLKSPRGKQIYITGKIPTSPNYDRLINITVILVNNCRVEHITAAESAEKRERIFIILMDVELLAY